MNKKTLIFLILFVISFFISLFFNVSKINIPYLNGIFKEVQTDVTFKNKAPAVFYENEQTRNYIKIDKHHYLFKPNGLKHVENIFLTDTKNIEKIVIYNGNEPIFIDKIQIPIKIDNNKKILDKISIAFLSFFYNPFLYIIPYIFLILFLYNSTFKYKTKWFLITFLMLGFLLRLSQINDIPFWDDEIYILVHTSKQAKLIDLFNDPGNPPLYFVLFKIYRTIVQNPEFFRYFSVFLGIIFNYCFYIYIKSFLGKKKALFGLFLVSINIILIYFSQEIRCYMLLMLLAVLNSFYLFKFNKKYKIHYFLSSTLILYTHFYGTFFVLYNFIFGNILFFKKRKKLINFLTINLISFLSFLPLLFYKKQNLTNSFNSWMKEPQTMDFIIAAQVFAGKITFCIIFFVVCFLIYKRLKRKSEKLFFKYNFFAIISIFIFATIFSYLIKPIFCYRYFYVVFPCYLALVVMFTTYNYKTKLKTILQIALFLLLTTNSKVNYQNLFCNHNLYLDFIKHDLDKAKNNYIFMSDTVINYQNFEIKNQNFIYLPVNQGIEALDIEKYKIKNPAIVYVPNLYLTENVIKKAKKIELYKTPLGIFCKILY